MGVLDVLQREAEIDRLTNKVLPGELDVAEGAPAMRLRSGR
jgi:hypothetical protein